MKNAHFQPKKFTTAKNETTLSISKINISKIIARLLGGPADAFTVAVIQQQLDNSTQAEMAGHWPNAKNQRWINYLIGQYYIANV